MKSNTLIRLMLLFFLSVSATALFAQSTGKEGTATIAGEVKTKMVLSPADLDSLPKTTLSHENRAGKKHNYSGVELGLLLAKAGVALGEELKGENLVKYILVEASDGYKVLFSLAEVDPAFTSRKIILANRKNGAYLSKDEGPFQLIIEAEQRKPRNIKQVISIQVKFAN